jgi:hypothetical protein
LLSRHGDSRNFRRNPSACNGHIRSVGVKGREGVSQFIERMGETGNAQEEEQGSDWGVLLRPGRGY